MIKEKYITFCKQQTDLPIFLEPWFLDLCVEDGSWDAAIIENNDVVEGIWPYFLKSKFGFSYLSMPHMCKYLGPYVIPASQRKEETVQELFQLLPKHAFIQQNINYKLSQQLASIWPSICTQKPSFQIDLSLTKEELWKRLKSDYRNNKIKKAKLEVEIKLDLKVDNFLTLNKSSFKYQKSNFPVPDHIFIRIIQGALDKDRALLMGAQDSAGKWHAGLCLMWDEKHVYYHSAGTDPDLRASGAGMYLIWESILWAKLHHGHKIFDFLGSEIPGIANVWKNFGAKATYYTQLKKYNSIWFQLLRKLKSE